MRRAVRIRSGRPSRRNSLLRQRLLWLRERDQVLDSVVIDSGTEDEAAPYGDDSHALRHAVLANAGP